MSMKTLENAVRAEAATILQNHLLKLKDILEWSTSEKEVRKNAQPDEVVVEIPLGAWVCVKAQHDRRPKVVAEHPADTWIASLYTEPRDTRNKLRKGWDEGYKRGLFDARAEASHAAELAADEQAQENGR